ncbi:MAG TPA: TauD/TfdA family dioxygenase [Acidimicrobiales bacterium]|nr:TauD/TfdA family dioxygenase [Acidimicrobiales bacterium]
MRGQVTDSREVDVVPLSKYTGAEIRGVDLSSELDDATVRRIREALLRWRVVILRGQHLTRDAHVAMGSRFGEVVTAHPTLPARFPERPEILVIEKDPQSEAPGGSAIDHRWHTDVTYVEVPPMGSILRAVQVPAYGADTEWTNLVAAYASLSEPLRSMIDGFTAVHENVLHLVRGEPTPLMQAFMAKRLTAIHPVVTVHPETGERVLYVNPDYTSHIVELSRRESHHVLACLNEHLASREFTVRLRWEPGDVAFWDNRSTAHVAPNDVPEGHHRVMERITLSGTRPVGVNGQVSRTLLGGV